MQSRIFIGSTPQAALERVQRELGKDALVLSCTKREEDEKFEIRASPPLDGPGNKNLHEIRGDNWIYLNSGLDRLISRFRSSLGKLPQDLAAWTRKGLPLDSAIALDVMAREKGAAGLQELLLLLPSPNFGARTHIFIGAHGVGKSTIVAKLAIEEASGNDASSCALVGVGLQRATDVDKLNVTSGITGCPCYVANDEEEIRKLSEELGKFRKIIVDTAGLAPWDADSLAELSNVLRPLKGARHLVISAQSRPNDMLVTMAAFSGMGFDHFAFTGMDRAIRPSAVLSCVAYKPMPISFISDSHDCSVKLIKGLPGQGIALIKGRGRVGTKIGSVPLAG
ncbi:MAG: hypothetical protein GXP49_08470 [Deltaproteobacteria bacterium]|nr:hypothetical protein [Deltaproteobacteria bacterium]